MITVLSLDDVAGELGASCLEVRRLICRGALKATRLANGQDKPGWRVTRDELSRYVAAGAPDFTHPPLSVKQGWHEDLLHNAADAVHQGLHTAVEDQLVASGTPAAAAAFKQAGKATALAMVFTATAAVKAVLARPMLTVRGKAPPYDTQGQAFAVYHFRKAVKDAVKDATGKPLPAFCSELFAGPDEYAALVASAVALYSAMVFTRVYDLNDGGRSLRVRQSITFGALVPGGGLAKVAL